MSQSKFQTILLRELNQMIAEDEPISLFKLAARSLINYSVAWRHLGRMESAGMVRVVRHSPPVPLDIEPLIEQLPLEGFLEQC